MTGDRRVHVTTVARCVGLLPVLWLAGCGLQSRSLSEDAVAASAARIAPGTPRARVHELLGEPFYTSERWRAELFAGEAVLLVWWRDMGVPLPTYTERKTTTLLVVYGPDGIVTGTAYTGPGCGSACAPKGALGSPFGCEREPGPCVSGNLQGLDVTAFQVVLAPAAAGGPRPDPVAQDHCSVFIDTEVSATAWFDVYLDGRLLQRAPTARTASYLQVGIGPGNHALACASLPAVWRKNELQRPRQRLPKDATLGPGARLDVTCSGGENIHVRVQATPGRPFRPETCNLSLTSAEDFAARAANARRVIVPDVPGESAGGE